ncbi:endonuclease [Ancylomarina sp. YFZ004]
MKKFYSFILLKNNALKDSFLISWCRRILPSLLLVFLTVLPSFGQDVIAFQSFESSASDTWTYTETVNNGTIAIGPEKYQSGANSLKMTGSASGSNSDLWIVFSSIDVSQYNDLKLSIGYAADGPDSGDDLEFWVKEDDGDFVQKTFVDGYNSSKYDFGGTPHLATGSTTDNPYIYNIPSGVQKVEFKVLFDEKTSKNNTFDHYFIDDVKLTGISIHSTKPVLSLSVNPEVSITKEADTENFVFTASLSAALGVPLDVNVEISGDNIANTDYSLSGSTISIPAGATTGTVGLNILNESDKEYDEELTLSLSANSELVNVIDGSYTLTIQDDDMFLHAGTEEDPYTVEEAILLGVSRDVHYAVGYIVGVGNDFESPFDNGNYVTVADSKDEVDFTKCLNLQLGTALKPSWNLVSNLNVLHKKITFNGYRDNYYSHQSFEGNSEIVDLTPTNLPFVSLSVSTNAGVEEEQTEITVTATSSVAVTAPQTVQLSVGGFQVTESDYSLSSPSITIAANSTIGSVTFTLLDDADKEADEVALISISSASDGVSIGSHYSEKITITNAESNAKAFGTPKNPTFDVVTSTFAGDYYAGIENKSSQTLRDALQLVVVNSTTHGQNYGDIWLMLKEADENPANPNEVWLIYRELGLDKGEQDGHSSSTDLWNREHVWAQSLGGFKSGTTSTSDGKDAYFETTADDLAHGHADGHHLRAAHKNENSSRGNKDFSDATTTNTYSPPLSARGDVARSLLYMEIRYNALTVVNGFASETGSHTIGDLVTLLKWHTEDPVDDFEKNRNNVIYEWQNNRNPFIDYPQMVDYIWGDKTDQAWTSSGTPVKQAQTITFAELANKTFGDVTFDLSASSTSNLEVSFELVSGPATLVGKTLTLTGAGDVVIKATQAGNANYLAGTEVTRTLTVDKKAQTITFAEFANKTFGDVAFDLSATSTSNLEVSFELVSGPATLVGETLTLTGAGDVVIKATQAGNTNYLAGTEVMRTLTVNKKAQTITFAELANKTFGDVAFDLSATSTSTLDVAFELVLGPATLVGETLTLTGAGDVVIKATQAGNTNYLGADAITHTLTVNKSNQEITFSGAESILFASGTLTLKASSNSGLTIAYSIVKGDVTLSGNILTLNALGEVVIEAKQLGNANYNAATPVSYTFNVVQNAQTLNFTSIDNFEYTTKEEVVLEANVSSGKQVTFEILEGNGSIQGNTLSILGAGHFVIKAIQAGDHEYASVEQTREFDVQKTSQTITFTKLEDREYRPESQGLMSGSSSMLPLTFELISGPATILGSSLMINGVGEITVKATQAGNENYLAADPVVQTFTVSKASQIISFDAIPDRPFKNESYGLSASSNAAHVLEITFELISGPATLLGSSLMINGVGEITVKATQAGNENYLAADPIVQKFTVSKASQIISFDAIPDRPFKNESYDLVARSDAGADLKVSFELISGPATLLGSSLMINGAGEIVVKASQEGNENYLAADPVIQSFIVSKANQTIDFAELADKTFGDAAFDLSATSTSNLEVAFELISGPASLTGKALSITGAGEIVIKATQSGNENILSAELSRTLNVLKADQTITFDPVEDYVFGEESKVLNASSTSLLSIEFEITEGLGEIDANVFTPTVIGQFTIRAYQLGNDNYNSTEATQSFLVDYPTGIDDVFVEEIKMYPNPTTDYINIDFPTDKLKNIKILNMKGQLIKTAQAYQSLRLNVQDLKEGIYLISIQTDETVITKRFVKLNN